MGKPTPKTKVAPNLSTLPQARRPPPRLVVMTMARGRPRAVALNKGENPTKTIATASNFTKGTTTRGALREGDLGMEAWGSLATASPFTSRTTGRGPLQGSWRCSWGCLRLLRLELQRHGYYPTLTKGSDVCIIKTQLPMQVSMIVQ